MATRERRPTGARPAPAARRRPEAPPAPEPSAAPQPQQERSLGDLFSEMTQQLQVLLRKEIELAKVETKEQVSRATKTGAMFGAMAVVGLIAALILAMAAAWGLAEVVPIGVAFLIVGVVLLAVALVLLQSGKKKAASIRPPTQTIATVKEDVDEAKSAIQRGAQEDTWSSYGRNAS